MLCSPPAAVLQRETIPNAPVAGWKAGVTLALVGAGPACVRPAGTPSHSHHSHQAKDAWSSLVDPLSCSSSEEIPTGEHGAEDTADFIKPVWKTAVMPQKVF